ncbi:Uncharacterized protein RNJ44_00671 [Nakaseomyces bracarensis]|uniref:AMMECR1 domain-containing protein n=1 Tax=Nakaseomyces bracarensis TaxID=273131 RepID=A0ABR4NRX0_9SACH
MAENKADLYAFYAFLQLYRYLGHVDRNYNLRTVAEVLYGTSQVIKEDTSLFITWKRKGSDSELDKEEDDGYTLRGCIGTFAKLPIEAGIQRYSLVAALEDSRFPPTKDEELTSLKCSCNILRHFERIYVNGETGGDINNWEIGKNGIELLFRHPRSGKVCSATFLPDVMVEQKWDKKTTFLNLIQKAGCYHDAEEILENYSKYFIEVIKYEGKKSDIDYEGFKRSFDMLESKA